MEYNRIIVMLSVVVQSMINGQTLDLDDFLMTVQESHPLFASESLAIEIETAEKNKYIGHEDWVITSSPYYLHQESVFSGIGVADRIDILSGDVALERTFWRTGGRATLSWTSTYTDQEVDDIIIPLLQDTIIMSTGPSRLYSHKFYLTYTQPLLQNFGGTLDRLQYEIQQYSIDISALQAQENKEAFILDLATRFLEWTLLSEKLRIAQKRLDLANIQLQQVKRQFQVNLVDRLDVLRSEDAVRLAEQSIVILQSQYKAQQAELAVLSKSEKLYTVTPAYDLYTTISLSDVETAIKQLEETSIILRQLRERRDQLVHLRNGYSETSRPQLFLTVGAGLQGGHEDLDESIVLDKPDVLVALDFRYPLGTNIAQHNIDKTDLEIEQLDLKREEVLLNYTSAVQNLLIMIHDMEKVLQLNQEHIASAQEKTQEETRLYEQGRNYLAFVIQSRDSEQQAAMTYAENAAMYHTLILQYYALMDGLLPLYGSE